MEIEKRLGLQRKDHTATLTFMLNKPQTKDNIKILKEEVEKKRRDISKITYLSSNQQSEMFSSKKDHSMINNQQYIKIKDDKDYKNPIKIN